MNLFSKPLVLAIIGGGTAIGVCNKNSKEDVISPEVLSILNDPVELKKKLRQIEDFLKIDDNTKNLSEFIKGYGLTLFGIKNLIQILSDSLLIDLIENTQFTSAFKENLKVKLDVLRLSTLDSKEYKSYGGENLYKNYKALQGIRKDFINEFEAGLDRILVNATNDLKYPNSSDDLIKNVLGDFYDSVFDDYIKYNKPLFVKRVAWKYANSTGKAKELYDQFPGSVPSNFEYPKSGSYLFPELDGTSKSKFKEYTVKFKATKEHDDVSAYTDDPDNSHIIVPISVAEDSSKTSQFIIAALELHSHAISFSKWADDKKGTTKANLSTKTDRSYQLCDLHTTSNFNISLITFNTLDSTYKDDPGKLFCLEKGKGALKHNKEVVSDFVYVKYNNSSDKATNWILFKDKDYVQAMTIGEQFTDQKTIKKRLIEQAKKKDEKKYRFDLKKELMTWLEKHFDRLFFEKWIDIVKQIDNTKTDGGDWKDVVSSLKSLLEVCFLQDSLLKLRNNVLKDYVALLDKYKPVKVGTSVQQIHPSLAWAGKFPYKYHDRALSKEKKLNDKELVFDYLEAIYLAQFQKLSSETLSFETIFEGKYKDKYDDYKTKWEKIFTDKASSLNAKGEKEDEYTFYLFNEDNASSNDKAKNIKVTTLMNNLWVSAIHNGGAISYLTQEQIKDYLMSKSKLLKWEDKSVEDFSQAASLSAISKDKFKDDTLSEDFHKTLLRGYLLSKVSETWKKSIDPNIYGKLITNNIKDLKDFSDLKTLDQDLRTLYKSSGYDLLSSENKSLFSELIALEYLTKDNLINYRKLLKSKLPKDSPSVFLFSKKYDKDGVCFPDIEKLDEALKLDTSRVWELKNRFLGFNSSDSNWKPDNCLTKEDIADFVIIKSDENFDTADNKTVTRVGYKGLVTGDKLEKVLPKEISEQINKTLSIWGSVDSIKQNIEAIKTDKDLDELIKKLKDTFSDASWSFVEKKLWVIPSNSSRVNKEFKLTLSERKKILLGFILQENPNLMNENYSLNYQYSQQSLFVQSEYTDTSKSFLKDRLGRFDGYYTDSKGSKVLLDNDGNKYLVWVTQVRYDDLFNEDNWNKFLKDMSADLISRDLISSSKDKYLQQKALYYLLNEAESDKGIKTFSTGDHRLQEGIDFSWLSS